MPRKTKSDTIAEQEKDIQDLLREHEQLSEELASVREDLEEVFQERDDAKAMIERLRYAVKEIGGSSPLAMVFREILSGADVSVTELIDLYTGRN